MKIYLILKHQQSCNLKKQVNKHLTFQRTPFCKNKHQMRNLSSFLHWRLKFLIKNSKKSMSSQCWKKEIISLLQKTECKFFLKNIHIWLNTGQSQKRWICSPRQVVIIYNTNHGILLLNAFCRLYGECNTQKYFIKPLMLSFKIYQTTMK